MARQRTLESQARRRERVRTLMQGAAIAVLIGLSSASAIIVKNSRASAGPALAAIDRPGDAGPASFDPSYLPLPVEDPLVQAAPAETSIAGAPAEADQPRFSPDTRWFGGRPVRPVKTIVMTVTGYSPGAESCGESADGITSSLHSVWTNGMKLVAADTRVLPLGSVVSVPGYHGAQLVPVLDRGGKIKGNHIDLLFPTAEQARQWGVKKVRVTVWGYSDGAPAPDWRKVRDSRAN